MAQQATAAGGQIPFIYRREIFWGDTDTARIVYTGKFADFMLEAAEAWMRAYLGTDWFTETTEHNRGGPVVHLDIDFMSPLTPKDLLQVEVRIAHAGETAITYHCTGYGNDRRLSFRGTFTSVGFDYGSRQKRPLPPKTREIIVDYQSKCEAAEGG